MTTFNIQRYTWPTNEFPAGRCTGENGKNVLAIVGRGDLNSHSALLKRIVQSVGLDLDKDMSLLDIADDEQFALLSSPEIADYQSVLSFGIPLSRFGPASDRTTGLFRFESLDVLVTGSLEQLATDEQQKRKLWAHLKIMFK